MIEGYPGRVTWKGRSSSEFNQEFIGCNAEETEEMKYQVTMALIDTNYFVPQKGKPL